MTINTLLYGTKNVKNFLEKDSTSGSRVQIAGKSNDSYFQNQRWRGFVMVQTFCWNTSFAKYAAVSSLWQFDVKHRLPAMYEMRNACASLQIEVAVRQGAVTTTIGHTSCLETTS